MGDVYTGRRRCDLFTYCVELRDSYRRPKTRLRTVLPSLSLMEGGGTGGTDSRQCSNCSRFRHAFCSPEARGVAYAKGGALVLLIGRFARMVVEAVSGSAVASVVGCDVESVVGSVFGLSLDSPWVDRRYALRHGLTLNASGETMYEEDSVCTLSILRMRCCTATWEAWTFYAAPLGKVVGGRQTNHARRQEQRAVCLALSAV